MLLSYILDYLNIYNVTSAAQEDKILVEFLSNIVILCVIGLL